MHTVAIAVDLATNVVELAAAIRTIVPPSAVGSPGLSLSASGPCAGDHPQRPGRAESK
jgi:hypothetical protein